MLASNLAAVNKKAGKLPAAIDFFGSITGAGAMLASAASSLAGTGKMVGVSARGADNDNKAVRLFAAASRLVSGGKSVNASNVAGMEA